MNELESILKEYWGYEHFRPLQEDIARSALAGRDTLALLPTGGGKSICFQVPAMAMKGLCLVISPLIALMKDQVYNLQKRGISAEAVYTGLPRRESENIIRACMEGQIKFLYVSPERLKSRTFREQLTQMDICLLAVDEAHCISQWGYDFRPPYLEIAEIREILSRPVPVLALTATATPEVVEDIQDKLHFKARNVFRKSFVRENLTYFVFKEENKGQRMLDIIRKIPGSGIVYVRNRKKTKEVAEMLQRNNISADFYHAGLNVRERERKQEYWTKGKIRVITATNAFGMGIDKPDVRFVIHIDLPDNLESYFQEAGRGGRDGKESHAILLYEDSDLINLERNFEQSYPPIQRIQQIYKALGNYYRIPVGSGKGASFPFDNADFAQKCQIKPLEIYNALKFIERAGFILFTDPYQSASRILFTCHREDLHFYQVDHPRYDPFIKLLLRSYPGLFTQYTRIDEQELSRRAGLPLEQVCRLLKQLQKDEILDYDPWSELPKLVWLEDRTDEKFLQLSPSIYAERKATARKRLDAVRRYVLSDTPCRSLQLIGYFGEKNDSCCGKCDVCLRKKRDEKGKRFPEVEKELETLIPSEGILLSELIGNSRYEEEELIPVIRFLLDNHRLRMDGNRKIYKGK